MPMPQSFQKSLYLLLILTVLMLFGCSTENDEFEKSSTPVETGLENATDFMAVVEGNFVTGSTYALHCPDDWNGDLVVYAHGYAFPEGEPTLPDDDDQSFVDLRDAWLDMGYGVAFSSFSETGWSVKQGMVETRQLRGFFASQFGMPNRTYLSGRSMGGLIALALAEKNPGLYDGVFPMCGVLGGTDMAIDYLYNVRLLFDYYYPGVLPGSVNEIPDGFHWTTAQGLAYMALMANPVPAFELAGISQVQIQYADPNELITAILTAIVFHTASFTDMLDRTHGHDFFDNSDVWYSGSADDTALNAAIGRFVSTPDAEKYIDHYYEPSGKLKIPAVSIHNTRDPVVQIFNEYDYAEKVAAAGYSEMLLHQYEIDGLHGFGHCVFTLDEIMVAFGELVEWVENADGD